VTTLSPQTVNVVKINTQYTHVDQHYIVSVLEKFWIQMRHLFV